MNEENFLNEAVTMAAQNVKNGGGPFGAVIVKDGKIIGRGINRVTETNDPTAHAEVTAIRDACKNLDEFRLDGAVIYTSCEPCPMCLGAIYWARIEKIVFAADKNDAAKAGFDDSFIYDEFALPHEKRAIPLKRLPLKNANLPFETWIIHEGKTKY